VQTAGKIILMLTGFNNILYLLMKVVTTKS